MTTALLLALSVLGPAAPSIVVTAPVYQLDCSRGDTDGEMDECDEDWVLGAEFDGFQLPRRLSE